MTCEISDLRSGIVTEFDEETGRGFITEDGGEVIPVATSDILRADVPTLAVGVRVVFLREPLVSTPHAIVLDVFPGSIVMPSSQRRVSAR